MAAVIFRRLLKVFVTRSNVSSCRLQSFNRYLHNDKFVKNRSMFMPSFHMFSSNGLPPVDTMKSDLHCWKCGKTISHSLITCEYCKTIQKIRRDANYFSLFGLKQEFALNNTELTRKFRELQAQFHPDKFAGKPQREQEYSSECSASLNAAYQTLINPVERGLYVLRLENVEMNESELEINDKEFLTEIMEINEKLTDFDEISKTDLQRLKSENETTIGKLLTNLSKSFHEKDFQTAKQTLGKLKYYNNIESKIKSLEIKFGIV